MPKTTIAPSRTVFDGGAHFDRAPADTPSEQSAILKPATMPAEELEMIFRDALAKTGAAELRAIRVRVEGSKILLSGRVSTYYLKQLAQEAMRRLTGAMQICNSISVDDLKADGRRRGPR